jgi:hypothetical protein
VHKIINRTMKLLTPRGALVEEQGSTCLGDNDADSDDARRFRPVQAAACTDRIAFGPRAGQKVLTLQGAMPRNADFKQDLRRHRRLQPAMPPCVVMPTTAVASTRWAHGGRFGDRLLGQRIYPIASAGTSFGARRFVYPIRSFRDSTLRSPQRGRRLSLRENPRCDRSYYGFN